MAHEILRGILNEIREAKWFSLIADETRDISGSEEFSISIRWVDNNYVINEDMIAFAEVEQLMLLH